MGNTEVICEASCFLFAGFLGVCYVWLRIGGEVIPVRGGGQGEVSALSVV